MSRRRVLIVVTDPADLPEVKRERLLTADRYLGGGESAGEGATVVNLCRSYRYRTKGYYVSLIADARAHQAIPSVEAMEGLSEPFGIFRVLHEAGVPTVDVVRMRARRALPSTITLEGDRESDAGEPEEVLHISATGDGYVHDEAEAVETLAFFGRAADPRFQAAAQAVHREWPAPVVRLQFVLEDGVWKVAHVAPVPLTQLSAAERGALAAALNDERGVARRGAGTPRPTKRASIGVLHDPSDPFTPSSPETLERLRRAAARRNVYVHRLGLDEVDRLGEYDALFIRALTGVREPSFQFALRAEMLDMPVVDDPQSIIRCSNKVFLEELLRREGIPTPRTLVVTPRTPWEEVAALGCPVVIKLPDGSFSAAVHKCADAAEYGRHAGEMFRRSPLIIAQEFLPTDYDWRVTVLGGRVLFTARYHMARGHWQIRAEDHGRERYGRVEAVRRDAAPHEVVRLALRAAALIGNGLYGVDIKETPRGPVVIEINDNPNLDAGYDDAADGAAIYDDIVDFFLHRIEQGPPEGEPEERHAPRGAPARDAGGEGAARRHYRPFDVAGMELEYAVVDRDLNATSLVEDALRAMAGRPTSDVDLGHVAFSNEIADHVFELKTPLPTRSLRDAEEALADGVRRFSELLRERFDARLLPTGMHPWLDPRGRSLWTRSNARIYRTYARLFDVQTHGWMNVQAAHLNLPLGREEEGVAMYNAAALLIPYLPAIAASSPVYDGVLQDAVDNRLAWILRHQARIPESQGELVPEFVDSFADYRRTILGPMYQALDRFPDAGVLRHEFFNARGAVFKFSRKAMEVRVLDTQECVRMDVAIAAFTRAALRHLSGQLLEGRISLPDHGLLVRDFHAAVQHGTRARVHAPHLADRVARDDDGRADIRDVLRDFVAGARRAVRRDEAEYLELVEEVIRAGSLSERIRAALLPAAPDPARFQTELRRVYAELADCLARNEPWRGRG